MRNSPPLAQSHLPITERHYPDINGTILAFDFGEKRIGVAVGETIIKSANPLTCIETEINDLRFAAIHALIEEWQPNLLIVGLPTHLDGTAHTLTNLSKKFAQRLEGRFNLPVVMIDERLSSAEASQQLQAVGLSAKQQKNKLDAMAAQIILQRYLDQLPTPNHAAT